MNGIEKIKERILEENEAKILELKQSATAKAAERTVEYEAKAQEEFGRILEAGKKAADAQVSRMERMARLDAKKRRLSAKQDLIQDAFDIAMNKLTALSGEAYVSLLVKLTLPSISTGQETLVFSVVDRKPYGKKVVMAANEALSANGTPGNLTLDKESRAFRGGLYIKDGNMESNCTFSALLGTLKAQMAPEIAAILFE